VAFIDQYSGKRRAIKRALKLHDEVNELKCELIRIGVHIANCENRIMVTESEMTGGDMGTYQYILDGQGDSE
jgi:hypothetical protein|tara:strand:+ start:577 stop:792 length:216 start_codon:yes stop_codon:yes gene_type:complete